MSFRSLLASSLGEDVTISNPGPVTNDGSGGAVPGAPVKTRTRLIVQPVGGPEIVGERDITTADFRAFGDPGEDLRATSEVVRSDGTYLVVGKPELHRGRWGPHHIEAILRRVEG